jgi:thiol-disulfide isomerase/thioredoxin
VDYRDITLKDVSTGQTFKLSDFEGKVVVLETMAVWCPLCLDQQREIQKAEQSLASEGVVSISLDIDPNEDEARVSGHIQRNGFTWRFAVSTPEISRQLRDAFGLSVLNPPSTPVIIFDRQQQPHLLRFGIKPASELEGEIRKYL